MFANLILKELVINNKFTLMNLLEEIELIRTFRVNRLVIAPAYYDENSNSSIKEVKSIVDELNLYLSEKGVDIKLYAANIVRDNYDNIKEFINGNLGSINDSRYVLLSVEESSSINELIEIIYEFNLRDYTPIIVGPEKINEIVSDCKKIDKLLKEDCLFQLDLASINGEYGKNILKTAKMLRKKDVYSFIGFHDNIKKGYINKDVYGISREGLSILRKNAKRLKDKMI